MGCHRIKDVSSMKCRAEFWKKIFLLGEDDHLLHFLSLCNESKETIIRTYKKMMRSHKENRLPAPPYPRIHHRETDRPLWEIRITIGQEESPLLYILWTHLMGNINEGALGIDAQDHTLHRSHIMYFRAKMCG